MFGIDRSQYVGLRATQTVFDQYTSCLAACKQRFHAGMQDAPFGDVLRPYLERGKMVRALLVFMSAASVGADPIAVLPAAEAAELCHVASLFHDDIMDEAAQRRGLPALHIQLGSAVAIAIGDYLLLRSFAVLRAASAVLGAESVLTAVGVMARCGQECCAGQIQELTASVGCATEALYLSIVRGKTASLLAAAAEVGALLGGGTPEQIDSLRAYGENIGIAFQLRDDMLDIAGTPTLGKPTGNSLAHDRPLLPLIYLRAESEAAFQRWQQEGSDKQGLLDLLKETGVFNRVLDFQTHYVSQSLDALRNLPPCEAVESLALLARLLLELPA